MANIIPADSSGYETAGSTGQANSWFSCTVTQTAEQAFVGTGSLRVEAADQFFGVELSDYPGFPAAPGPHRLSASMMGPATDLTVSYEWRSGGSAVASGSIPIVTSPGVWTTEVVESTAPAGTDALWMTLNTGDSAAGLVYYLDELIADNEPVSGTPFGRVTETDTARALGKAKALGRLVGTSVARALVAVKSRQFGRVSGVGTARSLAASRSKTLGRVTEAGTTRTFSSEKTLAFGRVTEVGTARPLTVQGTTTLGRVAETDTARPFTKGKTKPLGRVTESGIARGLGNMGGQLVAIDVEVTGGPFRKTQPVPDGLYLSRVISGPTLRRIVEGPAKPAKVTPDGPARVDTALPEGPLLSRQVVGPRLARTVTGPEA